MRTLKTNSTLTLTATVLAAVLVVANISSLNVALPELSRELGASQSDVQWMVDIYAFFLASLLLPAGALGSYQPPPAVAGQAGTGERGERACVFAAVLTTHG